MFSKRFVLLVSVLVTLNVVLWFAAPGLALRRAIVNQLFGPKMVRLTVLERNGQEWSVDRGVIRTVDTTQITLREADGRIQQIPIAGTTKVIHLGQRLPLTALAPRWRVLVEWPTNGGAAVSVDVERIPRTRNKAGT